LLGSIGQTAISGAEEKGMIEFLRKYTLAYAITFAVFALWGVARCLFDTMMGQLSTAFTLGTNELLLLQSVSAALYFVFAVPAVIYARTFGSKAALIFGLGSWCVGVFLFYPATQQHVYIFFICAAFVMSCGWTFVEISITPIIAGMGRSERTPLRLNFAHTLFPLGILATLYSFHKLDFSTFVLPDIHLFGGPLQPYILIGAGVLLFTFAVDKVPFPSFATERGKIQGTMQEFRTLLSRPMFRAAIAAQIACGAVMTAVWTLFLWYAADAMPGISAIAIGQLTVLTIVAFGAGRLVGTVLMLRFSVEPLVALFSLSGVVFGLIAAFVGGQIGVYAVIACCFSMSILFPSILGIALRDLGPLTRTGTALLYIGGATTWIGTGAVMLVWHFSTIYLAMLFPVVCFAAVLAFALYQRIIVPAQQINTITQEAG
jgi:MFS transporter, FHS family, L-fucose permease